MNLLNYINNDKDLRARIDIAKTAKQEIKAQVKEFYKKNNGQKSVIVAALIKRIQADIKDDKLRQLLKTDSYSEDILTEKDQDRLLPGLISQSLSFFTGDDKIKFKKSFQLVIRDKIIPLIYSDFDELNQALTIFNQLSLGGRIKAKEDLVSGKEVIIFYFHPRTE